MPANKEPVLVIHGGAGAMEKKGSTEEQRERYRVALRGALSAGYAVLNRGGEAMDAAVAAVKYMEDCPLFNSAHGAVFTTEGKNELEASIMLSKPPGTHPEIPASRRSLSLTLLSTARNPSSLARALYLSPSTAPHTMLSGATAEKLGADLGEERVDPSYFFTLNRWREHRRGLGLPDQPYPPGCDPNDEKSATYGMIWHEDEVPLDTMPTGTVGAVALDSRGCIAAVTSTGGRTNKLPGRIGDTPQLGSGYYAHEWKVEGLLRKAWRKARGKSLTRAVGISGTGDGDYFIRQATASTIVHRMMYLNESLSKAAQHAVTSLAVDEGLGGVIAVDQAGNVAFPLNCPGMYRGVIRKDGLPKVAIFADDELQ